MTNKFPFVGNDLSLDFINTCIRNRGEEIDLISTSEEMAEWLKAAGFATDASQWETSDLAQAAGLRDAMRAVMLALVDGGPPPAGALGRINLHLSEHDPNLRIQYEDGAFRLADREKKLTPSKALGLIAERASRLLASEDRNRVRACSHPDCILLFKDTSKSGKRRWCSMQTCGNRAKASTFRSNTPKVKRPD